MIRWLAAFAVTQLIEVPIYTRALRPRRAAVALAFGASCVSHPLVYFGLPRVWPGGYWGYVAAAEAIAVALEAGYLRALRVPRPVGWALVANLTSAAVGLALRAAFGWP